MQDSTKLLGFDARRALNFDSSRELAIDLNRSLQFDINRDLSFDSARSLPFGKRGVMFRGYVCPVCGAPVYIEAAKCDECGVAFAPAPQEQKLPPKDFGRPMSQTEKVKQQPKYETTRTTARKQAPRGEPQRSQPPQAPASKPAMQRKVAKQPEPRRAGGEYQSSVTKPRTFQCPVCNASVPVGSATCPKCTVQFTLRTPPPPEDALVLCPICDLKVASKTDYCTRCGEPLSPGAIARHKRELEAARQSRKPSEHPPGAARGRPALSPEGPSSQLAEPRLKLW